MSWMVDEFRKWNRQNIQPCPRTSQNAERAREYFDSELRKTVSDLMNNSTHPLSPSTSKTGMTFWSRYDTVTQPRGNTDHWTKLKQRAVQHRSLSNPDAIGKPITLDGKHRRLPHGLVPRMSEKTFDDFIVDALQGNMPGTYMYTRPRNVPNKGALQNCFSDRARDGFRYWLIERPKPTNFGKYGIGSFKTVLGVGNAPRT